MQSALHKLGEQKWRSIQVKQHKSGIFIVGAAEEQAGNELRDDGACFEVNRDSAWFETILKQ